MSGSLVRWITVKIYRFALLAATTAVLSAAYAGDSVTKELKANYAAMTSAFLKKDINPIAAFLSTDFYVEDKSGKKIPRATILVDYQNQMKMLKDVSWGRKITNVAVSGSTYLVTVEGTVEGTFTPRPRKDQKPLAPLKPHKLHLVATAKDSWTKSGGKWLLHKTVILSRSAMVDGKPVPMK